MSTIQHGTKPRIEVAGVPLPADVDPLVEEVVVEDNLHLPDTFVIRFRDPERELLKRAGIGMGSPITIFAAATGAGDDEPLIAAEVTALEAEFDGSGSHAIVRGYDQSHRLHRGRVTRTYRQMTDADIARKIAETAGLRIGRVEPTPTVHEHLSQVNVTDWEYLKLRAREIGYEVAVRDGKLDFCPPAESSAAPRSGDLASADPLQLAFGAELEVFRPRVTSSGQVKDAEVRGWDPLRKERVVARAPASTKSVTLSTSAAEVAGTFGDPPPYVGAGRQLATQAEAAAAANAVAEQIASAFAEAEGIARGNPKLKAGTPVSVGLVGEAFEGRYTLTTTRHVYNADGYKTHFVVSGRQDRSLLGLITGAARGAAGVGGVEIAIVADVRDPDGLGRVKLIFPTIDDQYVSHWARVVQPGAGAQRGTVILPEVGDEVLVAFARGDVRTPYVIGGLYNGVDRPNLGDDLIDGATGAVTRRGFISKKGHKLVFLDDDAQSGILLSSADDGLRIALKDTGTAIRINSKGVIEIEADRDITIKSQGRLTLSGAAGVDVESAGQVGIQGSVIRLN